MTAPPAPAITLTEDELQVLGNELGVTDFPPVLAVRIRHGDRTSLQSARDAAVRRLTSRGLLGGEVAAELAGRVRALARPARALAMRLVTPDGICRSIVVPHRPGWVSARRIGDDVTLSSAGRHGGDLDDACRLLLRALPAAEPLTVDSFGAPTTTLAAALDGADTAPLIGDRLRGIGAPQRVAATLAGAFATRVAFAEIVCHSLDTVTDRIVTAPGAVAVFYTRRGRLVSSPSTSPSGQLWTTLKEGSDHRVAQAIRQLTELAPTAWEEATR